MYRRLLSSAAFVTVMACSGVALGYETTTFSVALNDPALNGTISIDNSNLGNGTLAIVPGGNNYVYNTAFQYFTPVESGTYVFGQLSSPVDTVILLYATGFDGANPGTNFVEMNDDGYPSDVTDQDLQDYVTTALAGRACDSDPDLCPLLVSNLTAGVNYYIVVSTYSMGDSLGAPSDILEFFVIGGALVGVGGVPPAGYVAASGSSAVSSLASYLDTNDNSGQLAQVATYLDTATPEEVVSALKEIFPVNSAVAGQIMSSVTGQTSTVLIDKVGTVLGNVGTLTNASFTDANFNTAGWIFGDKAAVGMPTEAAFSQMDMNGGSGDMISSLAAMPYNRFGSGDHAVWVQGVGALTNGDGDEATHGYDSRNAGVVTGYEFALNQDNLVGMIASVFASDINLDGDVGGTDATTYSLGVYGQHLMGTMKMTGMFLASYGDYESHRYVDVGGVFGRPEAEYNGWGTSTTLSLSKLFDHEGVKLEPFVSANYSTSSTESYSESGGGAFNMDVSSDTSSTASVKGGVTLQNEFKVGDYDLGVKFKPYLGYQWELNEASNAVRLSGAASSVVINGQDADTAQVGLAFETQLDVSETSSFKVGVDLSRDKNQETGLAYVGYGVKF